MIKLIHRTSGTPMWVADDRIDEYLEAGHKLASEICEKEPEEEPKEEPEKKEAPKKQSKKSAKKK
jgi:hypothetical protein